MHQQVVQVTALPQWGTRGTLQQTESSLKKEGDMLVHLSREDSVLEGMECLRSLPDPFPQGPLLLALS